MVCLPSPLARREFRFILPVLAIATASCALATLPPIPLFVDSFDCGSARRWTAAVGGSTPPGPPVGIYRTQTSCSWTTPPGGDPFPLHQNVLGTPLVAALPSGAAGSREIVAITYNGTAGGNETCTGSDPGLFGVLRIFDGSTCALVENVSGNDEKLIASATPAIGDLDNDGVPEIVVLRGRDASGPAAGPVAYRWDPVDSRYERWWVSTDSDLGPLCRYDGPVLHDLNDDGFPEVISGSEVFDGRTGARLDDGAFLPASTFGWASIGDVDADGVPELVTTSIRGWNAVTGSWVAENGATGAIGSTAFADFGAPSGGGLDAAHRDGIAEIVRSTTSPSAVSLERLDGTVVFSVAGAGGGAPAIGDFDGDDQPEIAVAAGSKLRVFDLDCATPTAACVGGFERWEKEIFDPASGRGIATAVDLDFDGRQEIVSADTCWLRIFDGSTGDVLASVPRQSCGWGSAAVVANVNANASADIVIGSNVNCGITCSGVDPIQRGLRCASGTDCLSGTCSSGYCRCSSGAQCPDADDCVAPPAGTPGSGNTCRANRGTSPTSGFAVISEVSGRWGPVGGIWNQIPFSVTNVDPDGGIPATSDVVPNFLIPGRNDFRAADSICAP